MYIAPNTSSLYVSSEKLQLSPEELDAHISSKRFLSAVDILQAALRMIRRSELEDIGALGDLRTYFSNQEMVGSTFAGCHMITDPLMGSR